MTTTITTAINPQSAELEIRSQATATVPVDLRLFPAFDYPHEDGGTHWCVRAVLLGEDTIPVAEILDGGMQDVVAGMQLGGDVVGDSAADSCQHKLRGYLAALFASAPAMRAFLSERCARSSDPAIAAEAAALLQTLATTAQHV